MNIDIIEEKKNSNVMGESFFLIGLLNQFNNSFQTIVDEFYEEISWKQIFFLNCVRLFDEAPTIKEMAELLGCSHQNSKQILSKLQNMGYVMVSKDINDKRKQRISLTQKTYDFIEKHAKPSDKIMQEIFKEINKDDLETTIKVITQLEIGLKRAAKNVAPQLKIE